jgi:hypothetical protein
MFKTFDELKDADSEVDGKPAKYLVQRYIDQPCLVAGRIWKTMTSERRKNKKFHYRSAVSSLGYKFDLRLYVFVKSFWPLQCFIFRKGLCRFSTQV